MPAGTVVLDGVRKEVRHQVGEPVAVADHRGVPRRSRFDRDPLLFGERLHDSQRVVHERREPDRRTLKRHVRAVRARQCEQVFDDAAHAICAARCAVSRQRRYSSGRTVARQRPLDLRGNRRQRRPQLVRGVGRESALVLDREMKPIERLVERERHLFELVLGALDRDARREVACRSWRRPPG